MSLAPDSAVPAPTREHSVVPRRSLRSHGARCARSALSALGTFCARRSLRSLGARCARSALAALARRSLRSLGARCARSALAALARRSLRSLGARCASSALGWCGFVMTCHTHACPERAWRRRARSTPRWPPRVVAVVPAVPAPQRTTTRPTSLAPDSAVPSPTREHSVVPLVGFCGGTSHARAC